ncbi:MAG: sodium-dependent transporter [Candidatus Wallbacteria bacterium]|nr:sodium-dependent transporter [Candidatus Wallbacteria bacterium]
MKKETWNSKIGIILAVAGSAIGLGNFLRFPQQAAQNGGGAFLIPYFIALIFLGIPLMWVEWALGRMGGVHDAHSLPEIYQKLLKKPFYKYLGVLGLFLPFIVFVYYTYIESWCLAYAFFSASGKYWGLESASIWTFWKSYVGIEQTAFFSNILPAVLFFVITLLINLHVLAAGISEGIEKLCKTVMPVLLVLGVIMVARVLTLPGVEKGFGFLWNPDFSALKNPKVWLAAAGQIFFTLSLGFGVIQAYASYLKRDEDIALSGLTSSFVNEFAEVILGASIAIPAAVVFFGIAETKEIASTGAVSLGFNTLPVIFQKMEGGRFFGFIWFILLFFAGLTSSVSLGQPVMAFLEKRLRLDRRQAAVWLGVVTAIYSIPVIMFLSRGFLDEMDYWAGQFFIVAAALIEIILFGWVIGIEKGFEEICLGAKITVPSLFKPVIKYLSPLFIIAILGGWLVTELPKIAKAGDPVVWASRIVMLVVLLIFAWLLKTRSGEE